VGISDAVHTRLRVDDVRRTLNGFVIGSLNIQCKHLVLASGIFTHSIPPPPSLAPIAQYGSDQEPLLVIGSGFSAADVIISAPPARRIVHIFQWAPEKRPSPLRGCHHTAYPEYATVYRQMKLAAIASTKTRSVKSPMTRRKSNPFFMQRDWSLYEGFPNADIISVSSAEHAGSTTITLRLVSGEKITRNVGGLAYVVGRRGTLDFLSSDLRSEVLSAPDHMNPDSASPSFISGRTLRAKAESECSLEVAKNVFIIGSLTGDSLIRHAVGGCVFAAGRILGAIPTTYTPDDSPSLSSGTPRSASLVSSSNSEPIINGDETNPQRPQTGRSTPGELTNGHADLHLDRRKLVRAVEVAHAENRSWVDSGWWAGGLGPGRSDA
jgi:hypothetical protein